MPEGPECKYISTSLNSLLKGIILKEIQIHGGHYLMLIPVSYRLMSMENLSGGHFLEAGTS